MTGYPNAQLYDSSGASLHTTVVPGGTYNFTNFAPSAVTLTQGQTAYFNVGYTDVPVGGETICPTSAQVKVIVPGGFNSLTASFAATVCNNGTLTVSPVFASGSPHTATTAPPQP